MSELHLTRMGQTFFEVHIPKIVNSLDDISIEMKRKNQLKEKELELKELELKIKQQEMELGY